MKYSDAERKYDDFTWEYSRLCVFVSVIKKWWLVKIFYRPSNVFHLFNYSTDVYDILHTNIKSTEASNAINQV